VVIKDPYIREHIIYSDVTYALNTVDLLVHNIPLEDVIRWQAGRLPAELMEIVADEKRNGAIVLFLGLVGTVALILSIDWDKVQKCLESSLHPEC
jgi:hypothetical protein